MSDVIIVCTTLPAAGGYWHLRADAKGSNVPSIRSLLVLEERMMSLLLVDDWKGIRSQNLCMNYPSRNVLSLHSSSLVMSMKNIVDWYDVKSDVWRVRNWLAQVHLEVCMCTVLTVARGSKWRRWIFMLCFREKDCRFYLLEDVGMCVNIELCCINRE